MRLRLLALCLLVPLVAFGTGSLVDSAEHLVVFESPDSVHAAVRSIKFIGNFKTTTQTIAREMTFVPGDSISRDDMTESQQRIYNLGLFNTVDLGAARDSATRMVDIYVIVSERWYIWPEFLFGVKDRDWGHLFSATSKAYAGLGVVHFNVRGRREKLFVGGVLGYDPYCSLEYSFLALNSAQSVYLDATFSTSRTRNQSDTLYTGGLAFNEIRYDATAQVTWRVTRRFDLVVKGELQSLHLSNPAAHKTLDPSGTDIAPTLSLGMNYNSQDNAEYPTQGAYLHASFDKTGAGKIINYGRTTFDVRGYVLTLGGVSLCARGAGIFSYGGTVPVYAHNFLGLAERIRGQWNVKREGEDLLLGSAEIRIPLIAQQAIQWTSAPRWMPSEFRSGHAGIYATIFADAGTAWFRDQSLASQQWMNGVGAGLNFIGPYGLVLRTEYAMHGSITHGQFLVDVYAAF